jgi:hypothetical protein
MPLSSLAFKPMSIRDLRAQFEKNQAVPEAPVERISSRPGNAVESPRSKKFEKSDVSSAKKAKQSTPATPKKKAGNESPPPPKEVEPTAQVAEKPHVETPVTPKKAVKETKATPPALNLRPVSPTLADNKFLKKDKSPKRSLKVPFHEDFFGYIPVKPKDEFYPPKGHVEFGEIKLKTDDFFGFVRSPIKDDFKTHDKPSAPVPIAAPHAGDFFGYVPPTKNDDFQPHEKPSSPVPIDVPHTGDFLGYIPVKQREEFHVPTAKAYDPLPLFAGDFYGFVPTKSTREDEPVSSSPRRSASSHQVDDPNMFGYVPVPNSPRRGEWAANHPHEDFHIRTPEEETVN